MTDIIHVFSPIDGAKVGSVPVAKKDDVDSAVKRAKHCFNNTSRNLTPFQRFDLLNRLCDQLEVRKDELARTITLESGKTIRESLGELKRAISLTRYAAEAAKRIHGEIFPCDILDTPTGKTAYVERHPIGVIAMITPFNFPINTVMHKLAPALATGNTAVLKPSPKTPLSAEILREILDDIRVPDGMVEIVHGYGATGEALFSHPDVRMISFTGGTKVGVHLARIAGFKKMSMELGGNGALVILEDADLEDAADTAIEQGLGTSGQRCTAVKRLFVQKSVTERFREILLHKVDALVVGDPRNSETDIGPLIDEAAAANIERLVEIAINEGAKVLRRTKRIGSLLPPIILDKTPCDTELVQKETFGPYYRS